MNTDVEKVKEKTIMIAHAVKPEPVPDIPCFVIHPFLNTPYWMERAMKDGIKELSFSSNKTTRYDLTDEDVYEEWVAEFSKTLGRYENNLLRIYMLWNNPWKMTFMKICGEYLSEKDFAQYLVDAWTTQENPNMDSNVSVSTAAKMFRRCKKEYLMNAEELEHYNLLPEQIEVWRGVAQGRVRLGLSWTDNKEKAEWFQHRFGEKNELLHLVVDKKDVLAYLDSRNEQEIVLDVMKYKKQINGKEN